MRYFLVFFAIVLVLLVSTCCAQEEVGKRPYEMDWAGRVNNEDPPLFDFEDMGNWTVTNRGTQATFEQSREQQIWGKYVGKLTYQAVGDDPKIILTPPEPIKINEPFDAMSCWIYGNNWGYAPSPHRPQAIINAVFLDSEGKELSINLTTVSWEEWFIPMKRLTLEQIDRVKNGAAFIRFEIENCTNKLEMVLYFDNFSVFTEQLKPLAFKPRKKRGIDMFPGQPTGTNTGAGKLPFPNSTKTILPDNLEKNFTNMVRQSGSSFVFTYRGGDGTLTYTLTPREGNFSDISASWGGTNKTIRPCVNGGIRLVGNSSEKQKITLISRPQLKDDVVTVKYRVNESGKSTDVAYSYRLWGKSLVIDTVALGGEVAEVLYGHAEGLDNPRLVTSPFYHYGSSRPAVVISGTVDKPLFLTGHTDWYLSNSSVPFAVNKIESGKVEYQGGVRYINKTDGKRNNVYERFFITISPRFEEMLPNIPNPKSPYMSITGTGVWRAHGAGNRESDAALWTNVWRWGMHKIIVTDHETGWRDGGESFTFRTRTAPGKGGDQGQYDYARIMQDKLGFVYGPYNNYTDFAPVNEFWSYDIVSRDPNNQLMHAWSRCYAPKPAYAVEYCEKLAPEIQRKFHFSTAYCDVHTAVAPWERVDYDARVPGAGTFAATFYSYGEIMMLQKEAWSGPVYSEGNFHLFYTGLTDGNYAQDRGYDIPNQPWLVDIDLRKMHDLGCNFGMGAPSMFYGSSGKLKGAEGINAKKTQEAYYDRFFAATVAFGHPGFLTFEGGFENTLRSYYMLQQLHSDYTQVSVSRIQYMDENGKLLDTSEAVASGAYKRSQIVTEYKNGTTTIVNGNQTQRMQVMGLDLPPNGYAAWTKDKRIYVLSSDDSITQHRTDYAVTPEYLFVDGRNKFTRFEKAASNGIGICRILGNGTYEVLPYEGADCGFAIDADHAVALDKENNEIGTTSVRKSRGMLYIVPVNNAFSYLLSKTGETSQAPVLECERETVVPGEEVVVKGTSEHKITIPANSRQGERLWYEIEGSWIDFTVASLVDFESSLDGNVLNVDLLSHAAESADFTVHVLNESKVVNLEPEKLARVAFDFGTPVEADDLIFSVVVTAGETSSSRNYGMQVAYKPKKIDGFPLDYSASTQLRGKEPITPIDSESGAYVQVRDASCGGIQKEGIFMHPPWLIGPGRTFLTYHSMELPDEPVMFRASVGKNDRSFLGDGILFQVAVVDTNGKETIVSEKIVQKHEWLNIEADLSPWAGKSVGIRLIADIGRNDDSEGDWASWAEMRLETKANHFTRTLLSEKEDFKLERSPKPAIGVETEDLKTAKNGRLYYKAIGFDASNPQYPSRAVINGVDIGQMVSGKGNESENIWNEEVSIPLTEEAIQTLGKKNVFELRNIGNDYFKITAFRIELDLPDEKTISSAITSTIYSQPSEWTYSEGVLVDFNSSINTDIWFELEN